jgi:hypothetical protein
MTLALHFIINMIAKIILDKRFDICYYIFINLERMCVISSDNGIYVLVTQHILDPNQKEYRVTYGSAIDNIWYNPNWQIEQCDLPASEWNEEQVLNYFSDSTS